MPRDRPKISVRIISLLGALAAFAAAAPIQTAQAVKHDASKVITIVALGDSLTAGYGLSRKEAYPALIGERMRSARYEFEVTNAGWGGDTTAGALRRLAEILRKKKSDIVILAVGIDVASRGLAIEEMGARL